MDFSTVIEAAENSAKTRRGKRRVLEVWQAHGYADSEPQYYDSDRPVAVGNWNRITEYVDGEFNTLDDVMPRLADVLDRMGYTLEWSDEVESCSTCGGVVRIRADSYAWKARFIWHEWEGTVCEACLKDDPQLAEEYLETHLERNPNNALTLDIDPEEFGYVPIKKELVHGYYGGQAANPEVVADSLERVEVDRYLFVLDWVSQFESSFSVWVHEDQADLVTTDIETDGPDPAVGLKSALKDSAQKLASVEGEGIRYSKLQEENGTAEVHLVSEEDFVAGNLP